MVGATSNEGFFIVFLQCISFDWHFYNKFVAHVIVLVISSDVFLETAESHVHNLLLLDVEL